MERKPRKKEKEKERKSNNKSHRQIRQKAETNHTHTHTHTYTHTVLVVSIIRRPLWRHDIVLQQLDDVREALALERTQAMRHTILCTVQQRLACCCLLVTPLLAATRAPQWHNGISGLGHVAPAGDWRDVAGVAGEVFAVSVETGSAQVEAVGNDCVDAGRVEEQEVWILLKTEEVRGE